MSAPFLRLSVFEDVDKETNEPIMRCIDNRRLVALKEFANVSGQRVMVCVNFFSLSTITEVQRYFRNTDDTDGRDIRLRRVY